MANGAAYYLVARFADDQAPVYARRDTMNWTLSHSRDAIAPYSAQEIRDVTEFLQLNRPALSRLKEVTGQVHGGAHPQIYVTVVREEDCILVTNT